MGRNKITKKVKKCKTNTTKNKKTDKKATNKKIDNVEEEEEEEEDIVQILMKKCRMTEEQVITAHQQFLEERPSGEMSKEDFVLENEVQQIHFHFYTCLLYWINGL